MLLFCLELNHRRKKWQRNLFTSSIGLTSFFLFTLTASEIILPLGLITMGLISIIAMDSISKKIDENLNRAFDNFFSI